MLAAADAPESWLDVEQRGRQPPLPLIAGLPVVHFACALFDQAIDRFDAVGRAETKAERGDHAEPMQRQRLFEPFVQGAGRRLVERHEFAADRGQRGLGFFVGRLA